MNSVQQHTIRLMKYILTGIKPDIECCIDAEGIYSFSKRHSIENSIYVALRDLSISVPGETMKKFQNSYDVAIMQEAIQALELETISNVFEEAGIDHIPLKGSVVKYLYPMPDLRKSGDIDILIKPEQEDKIASLMSELGYVEDDKYKDHDVHRLFHKKPFINIEIHRRLVRTHERMNTFCTKVWDNVERLDGYKHLYRMKNEYLYTYLLAHLCKHLSYGGIGISHVNDLYVVKKSLKLDKVLLEDQIIVAELVRLNEWVDHIIDAWYENGELTEAEKVLEKIILDSGTFGSIDASIKISNSATMRKKLLRGLKKTFPTTATLEMKYGIFKNERRLYGFKLIYHWWYIIVHERYRINRFFSSISGRNKDKSLRELIDNVC